MTLLSCIGNNKAILSTCYEKKMQTHKSFNPIVGALPVLSRAKMVITCEN